MQSRKLIVLIWKHLVVRMRRFLHTPVEFLSPIMFFLILFSFKNDIKPPSRNDQLKAPQDMVRNTDVVYLETLPSPWRILYKPDTSLALSLMDAVGENLKLKRFKTFPIHHDKGYYGFSNMSQVADFMTDLQNSEAIVLFDDLEGETLPERLSYTIRMRRNFFTESYQPLDGVEKPHRQFGRDYESFMRLQWAIDTSFMKLKSGTDIKQRVSIQEFPYYAKSEEKEIMTDIGSLLVTLCWMSVFLVFVFLMSRLLEERATGIQELIKMVGVSTNLLGVSHFINVLPGGLVYAMGGTILLKITSNPLITHTYASLIFITLMLHYLSVIAMAFACSYVTSNSVYTVSLSVLAYVALWLPCRWLPLSSPFAGLLPHAPLAWFWNNVGHLERYGNGLTFSNLTTSHAPNTCSVLLAFVCFLAQIAYFFALSWYLSHVRPGNYGQALPWNFLFQRQYWTKNEVKPSSSEMDEEIPIAREAKYFEEAPKNMEAGIKILNITKVYPKQTALSNVSIDVYKGEITVLLGHNGAGKTTLMSIITGMISASEGRVFVNGIDAARHREAVSKQLGLCPQHNLFFPDLTVLEHVVFFTLLKGGTYKQARAKSYQLLTNLGIKDKADHKSAALSGGMKRRLQLACALSGDADVLVLDEPTSGLDVETRRELWDLLLSLRGSRTVLLSTHFMEEADALGDRVAALHLGQLRCHATPMYLKKAIGTGYRLNFTTNGTPREAAITDAVVSQIPDATLKDKTINSLTYNLPANSSDRFPTLFTALEERKSSLSIETIGVGLSTLDDVFMKLCSDTDVTFNEDQVDSSAPEITNRKISGLPLYTQQFLYLLKRQCDYVSDKKIVFLLLQIIIPILMLCMFTSVIKNYAETESTGGPITLNLELYSARPTRRVLCDVSGESVRTINDAYPGVDFEVTKNITGDVLRSGAIDSSEYSKYLAGIEINETDIKILYTTVIRHAAPVAMNLATNTLSTRRGALPAADGRAFTARLHPLHTDHVMLDDTIVEPKDAALTLTWAILLVFVILSTNVNFVSLPCKERIAGTRHIHIMSGCPVALHWVTTCVFHITVAFLSLILTAALACAFLELDRTLNQLDFILVLMLMLTLSCLSFFAFMYLVSFYVSERGANVLLIAVIVVFGIITVTTKAASDIINPEETTTLDYFLLIPYYTMPPHSATMSVIRSSYIARLNAACKLNRNKCPVLSLREAGFDPDKCCAGENPRCYMCLDDYAPWREAIILTCQFFIYMGLVILTEMGVFSLLYEKIVNGRYRNSGATTHPATDELVRAEAVYVGKQVALPKKQIQDSGQAMLVSDLHKNYFQIIGKSCNAVKGINLSVKKGECFGLLGVNGAGKSTTFKMLTAEEWPTKGEIYANGHFREAKPLSSSYFKYLRSLGYCPQFSGVDAFLTGRDNLSLLLALRGFHPTDLKREVDYWIKVVGLEKYSGRKVSGYSGGCARRLAAASALCAGARLALLDEPTAGVDVAARRRVWAALRRGLAKDRAIVICSHSMEEIEALCARVAIMSNGVIRAVGTAGELRAAHAAGHAVVIKLGRAGDEVDGPNTGIMHLKSSLQSKFNCTLKDEHKTMLHYHINETMRYSELFAALEELKESFPALIEDYSVTETTLEEVFLSFAKEQEQPTGSNRNNIV